jgi:uncharacterized iron-regulated membrane protein
MKIFFRNIHLYLSLAAGLVIMIACFTGSVLVFEKELQQAFNHDRYFVKPAGKQLAIEQLIQSVQQKFPKAKINSVKIYPNPNETIEVGLSITVKESKGKQASSPNNQEISKKQANSEQRTSTQTVTKQPPAAAAGRATHTAFVNPYTAEVIELYNYRETFFYTMFALHRWLLGGEGSMGKYIVGISTFIFLFILITGLILWWPKTKRILAQRLKIKLSGSWKRITHDLHIVLGFYCAIFLFIFAFTGLAWSFQWFNKGIYTITRSEIKTPEPPTSTYQQASTIDFTTAYSIAKSHIANVEYYTLRAPSDSTGAFTVNVLPKGAHETATNNYFIDQFSGQIIGEQKFQDRNLGQRVRSTFKPVHTGSIFGLPSKIIAFTTCLLGVTFPITGTIMWINRLKKNRKRKGTKGLLNEKVLVLDDDYED